jgi:pilus assembly protein Flp/PilA
VTVRWSSGLSGTAEKINKKFSASKEQKNMIKKFLQDETGLELSEYAVAAALVALAVITAFTTLGKNIGLKIGDLATKITTTP